MPRKFANDLSYELFTELTETKGKSFDRIVADSPTAASVLLLQGKTQPIYYSAHNLESTRVSGREERSKSSLDELTRFERLLLETAQETWLPSNRDLSGAAELAPDARLRRVPNVVDVASIKPLRGPRSQSALFVADFSLPHNRRSAHFLVAEVMPMVWKQLPQARLVLVGRRLALARELDSRIEVHGFAEDLPGIYAAVGCALVPLLESRGSPLKLIEAMAYAVPVVATPFAAGGVDGLENGSHYLEGDGAEGFADAVVRALSGRADKIGAEARRLAESDYSIEALSKRLA